MAKINLLRRSQLVAPFGPGAINILKGGVSVITGGLDKWFQDQHGNTFGNDELLARNLIVKEPRLEALLNVSHFRLPPSDANRQGTEDAKIFTPVYRFPTWMVCPTCHFMKKTHLHSPELIPCKNDKCFEKLQQIRFVVVCTSGHIQDFPWLEWVHKSSSFHDDCKYHLKYNSGGGGTLADIKISCVKCKTPWRGLSNITGVRTDKDDNIKTFLSENVLSGSEEFLCNGASPWHGKEFGEGCGEHLRAVLTTGSNVHFSDIKSSIFIPPIINNKSTELIKILNEQKNKTKIKVLSRGGLTAKEIATHLKTRSSDEMSDYSIIQIAELVKQDEESNLPDNDSLTIFEGISEDEIKSQEYFSLLSTTGRNEELVSHECNLPENLSQRIDGLVNKVIAIEKLKETRVFCGFTRLSHVRSETGPNPQEQLWEKIPVKRENRWLPASVTYGEGLLINLNNNLLKKWETQEIVKKHVSVLQENMDECQYKMNWAPIEVKPRYVLLHTLSHLLINQLIYECGYSSSSLRERIYSNDEEKEMSGILIYSASGDSEGTMGGLVRQAEPDLFGNTLENAINKAQWCSADPICHEAFERGGQGPYSLNMAACHCCCLLPETSCEQFNRLMDRSYIHFLDEYSIFNV